MKTNIYLRKTELKDEQKEMLVKKIDKLGKFFNDDAQSATRRFMTQPMKLLKQFRAR